MRIFKRLTVTLGGLLLVLAFYACSVEPFLLRVTPWTISTPKWSGRQPLKIAILSDMHVIWPWMTPRHLQDIVTRTNAQTPDIIVLLGDYVATHPFGRQIAPADGMAPLKFLTAPCGVFAVAGNHDVHPDGGWLAALRGVGITLLQNQAQPVQCHDEKLWVAGLEELWFQQADIAKTMGQVTDDNPVLMLMHQPDSFPQIPERITLSMAGHTHGGQIRLPIIGAIAQAVPSRYGKRYVYGSVREAGKDLVVSSGLGMSGIPFRLLMPPEITLVTLKDVAEQK
jgi:uncharacterized protein